MHNSGLSSDGAWPGAALLFVALASESRFQLRFLAGRHKERMLLRILDDFLGHHFPLEPTQSAFDRFTGIDCNYCHLYLQSKFSAKHSRPQFNTRGRDVVKRAKNDPANNWDLDSQGRLTADTKLRRGPRLSCVPGPESEPAYRRCPS